MFKFDFLNEGVNEESREIEVEGGTDELEVYQLEDLVGFLWFISNYSDESQRKISKLPEAISYSFISIKNTQVILARRELFDVKLQLISNELEKETVKYADSPSDLIRGVYEGGLKTWECSLDLASYLLNRPSESLGKVLEVWILVLDFQC